MHNLPDSASPLRGNKLLGLEAVRFISAFAVLLWHYQHFASGTVFVRVRQPFFSLFRIFYDYGAGGVQVFWCLSGFIFFWKYRDAVADKVVNGKKFFVLRFSRLYPLHLATLSIVALLQPFFFGLNGRFFIYPHNDVFHFFLQLFMGSAWGLERGLSFNGPIWSISLEVIVYFIFYLIVRYISRSALANIAVLGACAAAAALKLTHPVLEAVAFFYAGGLAAIFSRNLQTHKRRSVIYTAAWCFLASSPLAAWLFAARHLNSYIFFFAYIPVLIFCASQDLPAGPALQKFLEAAGDMTYSSYLLHFPVQLAMVLFCSARKVPVPIYSPAFFAAYLSLTLTASYFVYRCFELPSQKYLRLKLL